MKYEGHLLLSSGLTDPDGHTNNRTTIPATTSVHMYTCKNNIYQTSSRIFFILILSDLGSCLLNVERCEDQSIEMFDKRLL